MANIIVWPRNLLTPRECRANLSPFTRSGGRTLGGIETAVRTDLGWWNVDLIDIPLHQRAQWKTWDAISNICGGRSGLVAVPVWPRETAPYASGDYEPMASVPHSDGSTFSDGSHYVQGAISVQSVGATAIGATTIRLRVIAGDADLSGVMFSYNHALYQTGAVLDADDDVVEVRISPTVRELIPDGSDLNFDDPTCLCRLVSDRGMDRGDNSQRFEMASVSFVEANDYWSKLVAGAA